MFFVERPNLVRLIFIGIFLVIVDGWEECDDIHYTNSWAVHIEDGEPEVANRIAKRHGFTNLGQVGSLPGYYHFVHKAETGRRKRREVDKAELLLTEKEVKWVEQQQVLERDKRGVIPDFVGIEHPNSVTIQDPLYKDQWYLNNIGQSSGPPNLDINVLPVWSTGITGRGVVVAVLDDGIDYTHPDLVRNFDSRASYDFNDYDNDPMPRLSDPNNCHGTKCAGEVAAESGNGICGVGVAFNASIGGIRMLDGNTTDTIEGSSLSYRNNYIHIYSCAWGPKDDGKRFGRPGTLASKALLLGTQQGRNGLGSIFVWATGNGGLTDDDCNCDGYTTSIYTISIGAISDHGLSTYYTESCASTLAVTYSGGSHREKRENKIITTTLNHKCTDQFKGTSSAAPLAAGMIALMLEANSKLTWRDVQAIIVDTALMTSPLDEGWRRNGAGKWFNQKFGFGRMDAYQLVTKAKSWDNIPDQRKCWDNKNDGPWKIPDSGTVLVTANATACKGTLLEIKSLEHVQLVISLKHRHRGHLSIELISPSGTRSQILKTRRNDHSNKGLKDWIFMSVHFWGEDPRGTWTLAVTDNSNNNRRHYRSKVKHGDLEDATEALQDELMGRPRPEDVDVEGSSQEHEGVLENSEKSGSPKVSEDFEGGIFESESYRSSRKHSKKKKNKKKKDKKKWKKHKKRKEKARKHHKHYHSHKKSRPTGKTRLFTAEPTFFGKTFNALTQNKLGQHQYQPLPTQARIAERPNYIPQQSFNLSNKQNGSGVVGVPLHTNAGQGNDLLPGMQYQPQNQGHEVGSQSSVMGLNQDQTLTPTTRHKFEGAATATSQHEIIQGLVKSVLSELFTALRAQRNESQGSNGIGLVENQLPAKVSENVPAENVSSTLSKAWKNEKGVKKINSLIAILEKIKGNNVKRNLTDTDANSTRADEMVSDVLKVLRDIMSASRTDDKGKEFKMRVAKLIGDSSNETRNLTQRLFDDLQIDGDANRTSLVISDALSLISAIFQDDSQKKKNSGATESGNAVSLGQIGIVLRRPDGSLVIPNPVDAGIQMQSSPETMIRSWSNASQIETVRIEHTKVSPVNIPKTETKSEEVPRNATGKQSKMADKLEEESKGKEHDEGIEIEVERSGDGKGKEYSGLDNKNTGGGRKFETSDESGPGSLLNMRTVGNDALLGGPVSNKFLGNMEKDAHGFRVLNLENIGNEIPADTRKLQSKNKDEANEGPNLEMKDGDAKLSKKKPDKGENKDDQIDVTVFFDNNSDKDFAEEVKRMKTAKLKEKHGKFVSKMQDMNRSNKRISERKVGHKKHIMHRPEPIEEDSSPDEADFAEANEEENSRSKGEIPEGDSDDNEDDVESSSNGMYDMRESLPFISLPVPDQHGYSLLTQVFDPFEDNGYPQGFDIVNAEEQAPLIEDDSEILEPQAYKQEWKRSLQDNYPTVKTRSANRDHPTVSYLRIPRMSLLRSRRAVSNQRRSQIKSSSRKTRLTSDVASARKRFAELIRKVHERPIGKSLLGLESAPVVETHGINQMVLSDFDRRTNRVRRRRSVTDFDHQSLEANTKSQGIMGDDEKISRSRRRRSVSIMESEPKIDKPKMLNSSEPTVFREKRDKIIDDYDEDGYGDDYENEPHVVKRSAIFDDFDLSPRPSARSDESRSKRQADEDEADDDEQPTQPGQKVSSLEDALRKKLLSMKTQSKSVLKLLKRVHEDISQGNTGDLFKLEDEIANIEKREKGKVDPESDDDEEENKHHKSKKKKQKGRKRKHDKFNEDKLKAKSVTPNIRPNMQNRPAPSDDNAEDSVEAQEKIAYKQNPDEYLKYGAGNTGVLESWTLVFYGT